MCETSNVDCSSRGKRERNEKLFLWFGDTYTHLGGEPGAHQVQRIASHRRHSPREGARHEPNGGLGAAVSSPLEPATVADARGVSAEVRAERRTRRFVRVEVDGRVRKPNQWIRAMAINHQTNWEGTNRMN